MSTTASSRGLEKEALPDATAELFYGSTEHNPNALRASGFLCPDPVIHLRDGAGDVLVVSALEIERAQAESTAAEVIQFDQCAPAEQLRRAASATDHAVLVLQGLMERRGIHRVIVEDGFPMALADRLRQTDVEVVAGGPRFEARRRAKTEAEVEAMVSVQRANEKAVEAARRMLAESEPGPDGILVHQGRPLTSETIKAVIARTLLEENVQAGELIVASGPDGALPHGRGSGPIRAGEPVIIDSFPVHLGTRYFADMTRTFVRGTPDPMIERMYEAVLAAQEAAFPLIRPGARGRDVHAAVCRVLHERGFRTLMKPYDSGDSPAVMNHGTGHGLGLEIHEAPRLSDAEGELLEGDVVTVEPGLYHPGLGGIRIEDVVVVTADGCRNITEFPKDLVV